MNHKQIEGTILLNDSKFAIVRVGEIEYQISNWYGTKKLFDISNKDLPISCKGVIVKYTASFYGSRYKSKVFEIKQIIK